MEGWSPMIGLGQETDKAEGGGERVLLLTATNVGNMKSAFSYFVSHHPHWRMLFNTCTVKANPQPKSSKKYFTEAPAAFDFPFPQNPSWGEPLSASLMLNSMSLQPPDAHDVTVGRWFCEGQGSESGDLTSLLSYSESVSLVFLYPSMHVCGAQGGLGVCIFYACMHNIRLPSLNTCTSRV
jgi:hypothetical protein